MTEGFFDAIGGHDSFDRIVRRFYEGVKTDDVLRPMYPDDLDGAIWRLTAFLEQYWGGPTAYSDERSPAPPGSPRRISNRRRREGSLAHTHDSRR